MIIKAPVDCPSCSSKLEYVKDQLYCKNMQCPAKLSKEVENFAKKMKIKGLGPKAIEKLSLTSILDVYRISLSEVREALGTALGEKLFAEIEKSKKASLNFVLPSLNIRLIGQTASDKVCSVIKHIDELDEAACKKAGLGPLATSSLLEYFETNEYWEYLPFSWEAEQPKEFNQTVCISGKLSTFKNKAEATKALEQHGFKVSSSITKNTDILINESGIASTKTTKAEALGIEIVTNLTQLLKRNK